jgi:uncharacterized protein YjaG (DUF416 family)
MKGLSQNIQSLLPRVYQEILKQQWHYVSIYLAKINGSQKMALKRISVPEARKQPH